MPVSSARRHRRSLALVAAGLTFSGTLAHAADPIAGVFALANGQPAVAGELTAMPQGSELSLKLDVMFRRTAEANALKRYETLAGRQMAISIVSDDLQVFLDRAVPHVIDGHGQAWVRLPRPGLYHVFVDGTPRTLPRQVLRFDLAVGEADPAAPRALGGPMTDARVGPYTAHFDSLTLTPGAANAINLHIAQNGKPARDLHPTQGTPAQAVLIAVDDLHVVPVHTVPPDGTDGAQSGDTDALPPDISFTVDGPKPGTYRLFVAFSGGRAAYTAPFVAVVR